MQTLDWIIVGGYLAAMLALAARLSRTQGSDRDYFLGANRMGALPLATSTIATQCSTNSLLGAPAFVGFTLGGGLLWLQYELAVPLAMLALIWLLATIRRSGNVSVYAFLEERLGRETRLLASGMFLLFRGIATGVTVYGVSSMVTMLLDVTYLEAVALLMAVTIIYDVLGGMRAVVYSDVIQLILILVTVGVCLTMVVDDIGGWSALYQFQQADPRGAAVDFSWGFEQGSTFGFWPMLFGGLFLYMAYYGCDQSQAQRVLSARSPRDAERVLTVAGTLRFPIVLIYCLLGLALALYASQNPQFISSLPSTENGTANYNLVVPSYVLQNFPVGLVGLVIVGIVAAAMSSIDSSLNALSAATVEDFLGGRPDRSPQRLQLIAKLTTGAWGMFAVLFSFQVEHIAPTILEAINKIGSVANGPLLALFALALFAPAVGQRRAIAGFACGFAANLALWLSDAPISWLWWNASGCIVALTAASLGTRLRLRTVEHRAHTGSILALLLTAAIILAVCLALGTAR